MANQIVILGIFVADTAFRADRLPRMGETLLGRGFALGPGGKGSNQAVATARAGGEVHFITRLGEDSFAGIARTVWEGAGVHAHVIADPESYTGAAFIFVDAASGNNAIIVSPGAAARISAQDAEANAALIGGARVFMTQLEQPVPAAHRALEIARAGGAVTILNPAPAASIPTAMLGLSDFVTPNESEAEGLTGVKVTDVDSATAAARRLIEMGAGAAIVTLGDKGALYCGKEKVLHMPPIKAGPVVETTGAGDAFNGGLATALARGLEIEAALQFATATAAISVTRPGAAASMPDLADIEALLAR